MQLINLGVQTIRLCARAQCIASLGVFTVATWLGASAAHAQQTPPPGPAAQPLPTAQPAPAPQQPPPAQQPYPPNAQQPPPAQPYPPYAQQPPPAQQPYPQQPPAQQPYPQAQPTQPSPSYAAAPPPTPAASAPSFRSGLKRPDFSVRVDPLNWLLLGRLGLELEVEAFEWMTVEVVPIFVTTEEPVLFADGLHQASNGLGPLAGGSLGVGFWLEGNSFKGTVLRAALTNYGYEYFGVSPVEDGTVSAGDKLKPVTHTERRLSFMIGNGRSWGAFTLAGGIGLEYEMNQQSSCVFRSNESYTTSKDDQTCKDKLGAEYDDDELLVSLRPDSPESADVSGRLHPFSFIARISLGVVLDD